MNLYESHDTYYPVDPIFKQKEFHLFEDGTTGFESPIIIKSKKGYYLIENSEILKDKELCFKIACYIFHFTNEYNLYSKSGNTKPFFCSGITIGVIS